MGEQEAIATASGTSNRRSAVRTTPWVGTGLCATLLGIWAAAAAPLQTVTFGGRIQPLLAKHCLACHNRTNKQGQVDLSSFKTEAALKSNLALWRDVLQQLRAHTMPPEKAPQPADADRQLWIGWLEENVAEWDAAALEARRSRALIRSAARRHPGCRRASAS